MNIEFLRIVGILETTRGVHWFARPCKEGESKETEVRSTSVPWIPQKNKYIIFTPLTNYTELFLSSLPNAAYSILLCFKVRTYYFFCKTSTALAYRMHTPGRYYTNECRHRLTTFFTVSYVHCVAVRPPVSMRWRRAAILNIVPFLEVAKAYYTRLVFPWISICFGIFVK